MKKYTWAIALVGIGGGIFLLWRSGAFNKETRRIRLAGTNIGSRLRNRQT